MATLLLVDGHSQAYRAFFGMKTPLSTRTGELTGAVYGFARKLLSVLKEYKPEYVAVAFDLGDTWRHSAFTDYKATRERMPDEMRTQMPRIEQFLQAFNVPIVTLPNYEADDVLGALANQAAAQGTDVLIMTGDRDLFQLVTPLIKILYTSGGPNPTTSVYGPEQVQERYNLTPRQFLELKALIGDDSDNIPGVPGVGEKTALKLINEYGDLAGIYANLEKIGGAKLKQNLTESRTQVELNRRLVEIVTDLEIVYSADACRLRDYDRDKVVALFQELEFRSLINDLPATEQPAQNSEPTTWESTAANGQMSLFGAAGAGEVAPTAGPSAAADAIPAHPYWCVQDAGMLQQLVAALSGAPYFSFDVETTSTDAMQAKLVGLGVAWGPGQAAYIPVGHSVGDQLSWEHVRTTLAPLFANVALPKLGHNTKYDLLVLRQHGLEMAGPLHDTMTIAWLLDPASRNLGLKGQAAAELGWEMTELTKLIGTGKKQITMDLVEIARAVAYCGADVDATIQIYEKLLPRLQASGMWELYNQLELPLLPVLADMEHAGVRLDKDFLGLMSIRLSERLAALEVEMFQIVGHPFNTRSTQQMSQVLFGELGFPTKGLGKTSSGHYSTAVGELERLAAKRSELSSNQVRLLEIIFEQRQLEKLRGTYVDALPTQIHPVTGRVHTSFNQTGSSTGRLSSSDPNLQNIPIRTDLGREIRKAFVAQPGWLLISADYSQVELRVLAHVAQEETLIAAFRADLDIHAATATKLFDVTLEQVSKDQRGLAKTINFATIYGSSAFGISTRTELDPKQAQQFLDQYFVTYPRIKQYIADTLAMLNAEGYVQTLLGRKRFFPELMQGSKLPFNQRGGIERAAINAPIQGAAADIMKIAMIRLHDRLRQQGLQARILLQVHDELVIELPESERAAVVPLVRETMEGAYQLDVPLKVDVEIGQNWFDLEKA